jgi:hypothetical protein
LQLSRLLHFSSKYDYSCSLFYMWKSDGE